MSIFNNSGFYIEFVYFAKRNFCDMFHFVREQNVLQDSEHSKRAESRKSIDSGYNVQGGSRVSYINEKTWGLWRVRRQRIHTQNAMECKSNAGIVLCVRAWDGYERGNM